MFPRNNQTLRFYFVVILGGVSWLFVLHGVVFSVNNSQFLVNFENSSTEFVKWAVRNGFNNTSRPKSVSTKENTTKIIQIRLSASPTPRSSLTGTSISTPNRPKHKLTPPPNPVKLVVRKSDLIKKKSETIRKEGTRPKVTLVSRVKKKRTTGNGVKRTAGNKIKKSTTTSKPTTTTIPPTPVYKSQFPENKNAPFVAVGLAITFRKVKFTGDNIASAPFFKIFFPSFCKTASKGFKYVIYLSHDDNDIFFNRTKKPYDIFLKQVERVAVEQRSVCQTFKIKFVRCAYSGKPAWAQNDAMMMAYNDKADFFYRSNDDTRLETHYWTETFINALHNMNPPYIGVVGPTHKGGNLKILTHDFVHRSHLDIFGSYYPSVFSNWYADGWITKVYSPGRSLKLDTVGVCHTEAKGVRYKPTKELKELLLPQVERDKMTLERFISNMKKT